MDSVPKVEEPVSSWLATSAQICLPNHFVRQYGFKKLLTLVVVASAIFRDAMRAAW
jgi:hypothetical protein